MRSPPPCVGSWLTHQDLGSPHKTHSSGSVPFRVLVRLGSISNHETKATSAVTATSVEPRCHKRAKKRQFFYRDLNHGPLDATSTDLPLSHKRCVSLIGTVWRIFNIETPGDQDHISNTPSRMKASEGPKFASSLQRSCAHLRPVLAHVSHTRTRDHNTQDSFCRWISPILSVNQAEFKMKGHVSSDGHVSRTKIATSAETKNFRQ
jgi:hypothetical protein